MLHARIDLFFILLKNALIFFSSLLQLIFDLLNNIPAFPVSLCLRILLLIKVRIVAHLRKLYHRDLVEVTSVFVRLWVKFYSLLSFWDRRCLFILVIL